RLLEDLKSKEKERRDYRRRMVAAIKRLQAYEKTSGKAEVPARGKGRTRLTGLAAGPGFGRGRAHLLQPPVSFALVEDVTGEDPEHDRKRLRRAVKQSAAEMGALQDRLSKRLPEFDPAIIDAHRLMLQDHGFLGKVEGAIADGLAAEAALR